MCEGCDVGFLEVVGGFFLDVCWVKLVISRGTIEVVQWSHQFMSTKNQLISVYLCQQHTNSDNFLAVLRAEIARKIADSISSVKTAF